MQWRNTADSYGSIAKFLHWAIVILIIAQYFIAEAADELPDGLEKLSLISRHKSFGMLVLILAVVRIGWRLANRGRPAPVAMPRRQQLAAAAGHGLLYLLILAQPLTGWAMSSAANYPVTLFGWLAVPGAGRREPRSARGPGGSARSDILRAGYRGNAARRRGRLPPLLDEGRRTAPDAAVRGSPPAVRSTGDLRPSRLPDAGIAAALLTMLVLSSTAHAATAWAVDPARSQLAFIATQAGGEFDGHFQRFRADIAFDPRDLAGSSFRVSIETASADTQDDTRDQALIGDDFFASGRWPTATFEARQFTAAPDGRFEARGRLSIRGIARDVKLIFTFDPAADGRSAVLKGGTTIQRLDFGVGQGEWKDTKWVGNEVRIQFSLALRPASAGAGVTGG